MPPRKGPVGLSDYKGGGGHGDDDEDDDKQKKTYVGSGINVLDPKKASAVDKIVHAATEKAKAKAQGGHSAEDEEEDGGAAPPNAVNITFWKNGFTVDDGPLRSTDDPANKEFLASVENGRVPKELEAKAKEAVRSTGTILNIGLHDKRSEMFVEPPYRAFGGSGASLGSSAPAAPKSALVSASAGAARVVTVDETKDKTMIQVKLCNGKREKITLNLTHTVADLQAKVASFNATPPGKGFSLSAGFPPKPLADPDQTIEQAGLKMASVDQKVV